MILVVEDNLVKGASGHVGRKKNNFIIEIQITALGTAPPAGFGISNTYSPERKIVKRIKVRYTRTHQNPGIFLVFFVIPSCVFFCENVFEN